MNPILIMVVISSLTCSSASAQTEATLNSNTSDLTGQLCDGPVVLTCRTRRLPTIRWFINKRQIAVHIGNERPYPQTVVTDSMLPGLGALDIVVYNGDTSGTNSDTEDFESTLTTTLSELLDIRVQGAPVVNISCGSLAQNGTIYVSFSLKNQPPSASDLVCLLDPSSNEGQATITLSRQDSLSDTQKYRVSVTPEIQPTCSGMHDIGRNGRFECSGLEIGRKYSFLVNGIVCSSIHGEKDNITVHPQTPAFPTLLEIVAAYDAQSMAVNSITVMWNEVSNPTTISSRCLFPEDIEYQLEINVTTTVGNTAGAANSTRRVDDQVCGDHNCSVTIENLPPGESYQVSLRTRNTFGLSSNSTFPFRIASSSSSLLEHFLMFENCITFAMCLTSLDVKNCTVRFDQDPDFLSGGSRVGSVNELFELPILQRSTRYYHLAEITVNSNFSLTSRGIFTTGDFAERLSSVNRILIGLGIVLLVLGLSSLAANAVAAFAAKNFTVRMIISGILMVEVIGALGAVFLWVVVAVRVSTQKNTCDTDWQGSRDLLILCAAIASGGSFLVSVPVLIGSWTSARCIKSGTTTRATQNRKLAVQYYDYIDSTKAQEKGIRVEDNYAYNHPVAQESMIAETTLNSATSDDSNQYLDPNKIQRRARKTASKETTYASPNGEVGASSSVIDNEQKKLEVVPSKGTENSKKTAGGASAYAPPIPNLGGSHDEVTEGKKKQQLNASHAETDVGKKRLTLKKPIKSADSPKVVPEDASTPYAPPIPNLGGSQSELNKGQKRPGLKVKESFKGKTTAESAYAPPVPNLGGSASNISGAPSQKKPTKSNKPLHLKPGTKKTEQHAYAPTFSSLETKSQTGQTGKAGGAKPAEDPGYVGPVVAPAKHTEGIELKDNYAYKVAKKKEQAAYASTDEGYEGPVVAPAKHTEGISLKNNTAYKAASTAVKPKKKARRVQKPIDNSDLCKAYT